MNEEKIKQKEKEELQRLLEVAGTWLANVIALGVARGSRDGVAEASLCYQLAASDHELAETLVETKHST